MPFSPVTPWSTVPIATSMGLIVPAAFPYKEVYAGTSRNAGLN